MERQGERRRADGPLAGDVAVLSPALRDTEATSWNSTWILGFPVSLEPTELGSLRHGDVRGLPMLVLLVGASAGEGGTESVRTRVTSATNSASGNEATKGGGAA